MKLESLKNDKFEAFKENEIQNKLKVVGGVAQATTYRNVKYHGTDVIDVETYTSSTPGNPGYTFVNSNPRPGSVDYANTSWIPN